MNIFHFVDYRDYLIAVFRQRQTRNSAYSVRAFARDLTLTASLVSRILRRRDSISAVSAKRIVKALKLSPAEAEYFIELHLLRKSNDPFQVNRLREIHKFEITRKNMDGSYLLDLKDFANFLKISLVKEIKATTEFALMLDRQPKELWASCERLAAAGYLIGDKDKGWSTNLTHVLSSDEASEVKKEFHRLYLMNAIDALFKHPEERYFYSAMRTFNNKDYEVICRKLEEFITDIRLSPSSVEDHNMIYMLGAQLLPLEPTANSKMALIKDESLRSSDNFR